MEQLSPCTVTAEPVLSSPGATTAEGHAPESPCSVTTEATMRSPRTITGEDPTQPQTRITVKYIHNLRKHLYEKKGTINKAYK